MLLPFFDKNQINIGQACAQRLYASMFLLLFWSTRLAQRQPIRFTFGLLRKNVHYSDK